MQKSVSKNLTRILIVAISIVAIISIAIPLFATLFSSNVPFGGDITTGELNHIAGNGDVSGLSLSYKSSDLQFSSTNDEREITLTITNNSSEYLNYYYGISLVSPTSGTDGLADAILVFFDGNFIDTLSGLCQSGEGLIGETKGYFVLPAVKDLNGAITSATRTHTLSFKLHNSATDSYFVGKTCKVKIISYAKTSDYSTTMFVDNEKEFDRAVDDINNGLENASIVLTNDVILTDNYHIYNPCKIDLGGNQLILSENPQNQPINLYLSQVGEVKLTSLYNANYSSLTSNNSSKIVLDSENAYFAIDDFYFNDQNIGELYANKVLINNFDRASVLNRLTAKAENATIYGINAGESKNIFGAMAFYFNSQNFAEETYKITATSSNCTFTNGVVLTPVNIGSDLSANLTLSYTNNNATFSNEISFYINGDVNSYIKSFILQNYLINIPNISAEGVLQDVSCDLFLPTSISDKNAIFTYIDANSQTQTVKTVKGVNAIISWKTSNENLMDSTGKLGVDLKGDTRVILTAVININGKVFTHDFNFRVYAQNNEMRFAYFLSLLGPLTLSDVSEQGLRYIQLPTSDKNSDNYYQNAYSAVGGGEAGNSLEWLGCDDLGINNIAYAVDMDTYYYYLNINSDSHLYLKYPSFDTISQIEVRATFEGDFEEGSNTVLKEYVGSVTVNLSLGDNSSLQEVVFSEINKRLSEINVLDNILSTRTEKGMAEETGDFYLPATYYNYDITYSIGDNTNIIQSITYVSDTEGYLIRINPEYFENNTATVYINATIQIPRVSVTTQTKVFTFTTPGAIHNNTSGFADKSTFDSVKYQVFQQLATNQQGGNSGYSIVGDELVLNFNNFYDYILIYDIENSTKLVFANESDNLLNLLNWASNTSNKNQTAGSSDILNNNLYSRFYSNGDSSISSAEQTAIKIYYIFGEDIQDGALINLLDWAFSTSNSGSTAFSVVGTDYTNTINGFAFSLSTCVSNGKAVFSDEEGYAINVYLNSVGGNISSKASEFDALWNTNVSKKSYTVYTDLTGFIDTVTVLFNNNKSSFGASDFINKFNEIINWMTSSTASTGDHATPNLGFMESRFDSSCNGSTLYSYPTEYNAIYQWFYAEGSYYPTVYNNDGLTTVSDYEFDYLYMWLGYRTFSTNNHSSTRTVCQSATIAEQMQTALIESVEYHTTYYTDTGRTDLYNAIKQNTVSKIATLQANQTLDNKSIKYSYIKGLDSSTYGLTYFINLTELYVFGSSNANTPISMSSEALSAFFNRVVNNMPSIKALTMNYCAISGLTTLDISKLSKLQNLERLDIANNSGIDISTLGALDDLNQSKLSYLNISGVNIDFEYIELSLMRSYFKYHAQNNEYPTLYYGNDILYSPSDSFNDANYKQAYLNLVDCLFYLKDIGSVSSEYLQLTKKIYSNSQTFDIDWKLEQGNGISQVTNAINYTTISSATAMDEILSESNSKIKILYVGESTSKYIKNTYYTLSQNSNGEFSYVAGENIGNIGEINGISSAIQTANNNLGYVVYEQTEASAISIDAYSTEPEYASNTTNNNLAKTDTYQYRQVRGNSSYIGYLVSITNSGTYSFSSLIAGYSNSTTVNFAITIYDESNSTLYQTLSLSQTSIRTKTLTTVTSSEITLEKGVYVFRFTNTTTSNTRYLRVNSFTITPQSVETSLNLVFYKINLQNSQMTATKTNAVAVSSSSVLQTYLAQATSEYYIYTGTSTTITVGGKSLTLTTNHAYCYDGETVFDFSTISTDSEATAKIAQANSDYSAYLNKYFKDTSTNKYYKITFNNKYSYQEQITTANYSDFQTNINEFTANYYKLYYYSGVTTNSYTYGVVYEINFSILNGFSYSDTSFNYSNATTMQQILALANNNTYGNYYYYSGATYNRGGVSYIQGHIYRLLLNENGEYYLTDNVELTKKPQTCEIISSASALNTLLASATLDPENYLGKVYIYTSSETGNAYATNRIYEFMYDESGVLALKTFGSATISSNGTGAWKIQNDRYDTSTTGYRGTGGNSYVVITATISTSYTDSLGVLQTMTVTRKFMVYVIGTSAR